MSTPCYYCELGKPEACKVCIHGEADADDLLTNARDSGRWSEALRHIGGAHTDNGAQRFTLRYLSPIEGANIMRGSVAEHFTDAIDAALAAQGKDKE